MKLTQAKYQEARLRKIALSKASVSTDSLIVPFHTVASAHTQDLIRDHVEQLDRQFLRLINVGWGQRARTTPLSDH